MKKSFTSRSGGVARIRRDTYGPDWRKTTEEVKQNFGYKCAHPGCTETVSLHSHHIQRLSRGGVTTKANLLLLCDKHHGGRHSHLHHHEPEPAKIGYVPGGKLDVPTLSQLKREQQFRKRRRP